MKTHAFEPHPVWQTRNMCEFKWDDDGRVGHCGKPRSDLVHQEGAAEHRGDATQGEPTQEAASPPVVAPAGRDPASPGSTPPLPGPRCGMCGKTGLRMSEMRIEGCARGRPRASYPLCVDCAESVRALMDPSAVEAKR